MPTEARKLIASFGSVVQGLVRLAGEGLDEADLLAGMTRVILGFARCSSADLFLLEQGQVRHFVVTSAGVPSLARVVVGISDADATSQRAEVDSGNSVAFSAFCCDVLARRIECKSEHLVAGRAFWTDRAAEPLEMVEWREDEQHDFLFFSDYSYPSIAFLPFDLDQANRGLLVLKNSNQSFFAPDTIELLQGTANLLGMPIVHHRTQVALRERIKELGCLYEIAKLAGATDTTLEDVLRAVADLLPPAWLHPERTSARVVLDDTEFRSSSYEDGAHRLRSDIIVERRSRGYVEVTYAGEASTLNGPFLDEERHLIDLVARELSLIVEQSAADEHRRKLQEQLLHADRLATIGQLSAGVAHELNEPLGGILGFAQLSLKVPGVPEQVQRDLDRIVAASLHAREVIRKLLLFARQSGANKGWVDLNALVTDGLYFLESRCAKAGVQLVRQLAPDLPEIQGEPGQIYQVVVNLAVNAIQAMPDGGCLTISTATEDGGVRVTVQDTGTGMSDDVKRQLFVPFFTTKEIGQGTGLGLSVVEGIVGSHGGSIEVESTEGVGSIFSVYLPRKAVDLDEAKEG